MSEELHAAAVIAALTAANAFPFDIDDVPTTNLPAYFTQVTVSRRFGGQERGGALAGPVGWRVTTRAVAKSVTNAREMRRRAQVALENVRLTVDGKTTSPIRFESADAIGPDEGWYSGLTYWTYTY